jgi:hypothetical protein
MTLQEIQDLAGHRDVPPWVVKLVGDAVAKEREACANIADEWAVGWPHPSQTIADWIRKRGQA